jgi:hypothetical protein
MHYAYQRGLSIPGEELTFFDGLSPRGVKVSFAVEALARVTAFWDDQGTQT